MFLWTHRIYFWHPSPFLYGKFQILPGQRSKLMTSLLSKNIFPEFFFGRTLTLQFRQTCHYFSIKSPSFSAQSPNNWKKKQFFKVRFPQMFPLNTCIAVLAHLDSLFATGQKNCCRSKFQTRNIVSLVKELIFRKTFLWTRGWHLWQLWKKFSEKSSYFSVSNSKEFWNNVQSFKHVFSLKVFQGYVGYSFDNSGELFRQSEPEGFAQNPKNLVSFSFF